MAATAVAERVVLEVVTGSTAYDLATPDSDVDRLLIFQASTTAFLGLDEPPDGSCGKDGQGDYQRWELRKFCRLALKGNPGALEALCTPGSLVVREDWPGVALRRHRQWFLSQALYARYRGYAESQHQRMRKDGRSSHGHHIPPGETYDHKAAAHLLRLLVQGARVLRTGALEVSLSGYPQYDLIKAVRAGKLPLGAVLDHVVELRQQLDVAAQHSVLPEQPNYEAVNEWLIDERLLAG